MNTAEQMAAKRDKQDITISSDSNIVVFQKLINNEKTINDEIKPDVKVNESENEESKVIQFPNVNDEDQTSPSFDALGEMFNTTVAPTDPEEDKVIQFPVAEENATNNLFETAYQNNDSLTKVDATVVTEEDEKIAKSANMKAYEELYDKGPGHHISILRKFSEEAAKWIEAADKSGFVSGEMHDMAKSILREYKGLQNKENEFQDDKIIQMPAQYDNVPISNSYPDYNSDNVINLSEYKNDEGIKKDAA